MKRKIFLLSLLLALGAVSFSEVDLSNEAARKEAEKILENARKRIQKEEKERAKAMEEERKRAAEEEAKQQALAEEMKKNEGPMMMEGAEATADSSDRAEQEKAMEAARERNGAMAVEGMAGASATDKEKLVAEYLKEKERLAQEEKKNLKTPMEKLEYTRKQALEKVDFYERVVRSVAREEADIKSFKEILDTDI